MTVEIINNTTVETVEISNGVSGGVSKTYVDNADTALQNNLNDLNADDIAPTETRVFLTPAELIFLQQLKANYES